MKNCCTSTTIIPSQCESCEELIDSLCVIDSSGLACLDVSANTPQGEINQILARAICELAEIEASGCCPEWLDVTDYAASGEYEWAPAPSGEIGIIQTPQYTTPLDCNCNKVKLRGVIVGRWTASTMLMFTLPVGIGPTNVRTYPTVVIVGNEKFYYPALILVKNNEVSLLLGPATCCNSNQINTGDILVVTLESVEFENV